jgi:5'-3' exoribonuclease 1
MSFERYSDSVRAHRRADLLQTVVIHNLPRRALLKPEHAEFRLQKQSFMLGDRVVQVQETGNVPLCNKGVVIGVTAGMLDVLWDQPFIGGTTLGNRCVRLKF